MKITKKRIILITTLAIVAGILITAFVLYWNNFRGIIPLIRRPSLDISEAIPGSVDNGGELEKETTPEDIKDEDTTGAKEVDKVDKDIDNGKDDILQLEDDFNITIFASDVPAARVLAVGPEGNLWVSQTGIGKITRITVSEGIPIGQSTIFEGLNNPHGMAFDPEDQYILY
ncbi:MAG: hypothetical protein V3R31_06850, partial [Candidatus Humimicrobiaceae bacterium]